MILLVSYILIELNLLDKMLGNESCTICPHLKLLAVATQNIKPEKFSKLEYTAELYCYNYEILGRFDSWQGFKTKIKLYYEALKKVTEPCTILIDSTDTFLYANSWVAYNKFISTGQKLITGAETFMYYPKAFHDGRPNLVDSKTMKVYITRLGTGKFRFPNSGFTIGYTTELIKLYSTILDYDDDQCAYFDSIYLRTSPMVIDYTMEFVANIPNYFLEPSSSYYRFDSISRSCKNIFYKTEPIAFHFPGNYHAAMTEYFTALHGTIFYTPNIPYGIAIIVTIIILLLIVLIILISQ